MGEAASEFPSTVSELMKTWYGIMIAYGMVLFIISLTIPVLIMSNIALVFLSGTLIFFGLNRMYGTSDEVKEAMDVTDTKFIFFGWVCIVGFLVSMIVYWINI